MIQIDDVLVSENLLEEYFNCDLSACKGACCVQGDAGAPVKEEEVEGLEKNLTSFLKYIPNKGRVSIAEQGVAVVDEDGDIVTPLNNGKECSFAYFDENGMAKCSIETAYIAGESSVNKPISCHLYPIRITRLKHHDALNYHRWPICSSACTKGVKTKTKVYEFCKNSLITVYGQDWYDKLVEADKLLMESKSQ